jgi:DNA-binding transcriptional ArsR family regulator
MKHLLVYNQQIGTELGIRNITQGLIFDFLTGVAVWANPEQIDGETYYWVARSYIATQLACLQLKPDTIYRHLRALADLGLIVYRKKGKKDCIQLTSKARIYYIGNKSGSTQKASAKPAEKPMSDLNPKPYVGSKSEKERAAMSDLNPGSYVGNESENNSDLNPTDTTIKINTKDKADNPSSSTALAVMAERQQTFAMHLRWHPRKDLPERCQAAGIDLTQIPPPRAAEILGEFRSYWSGEPRLFNEDQWQHKFFQNLKSLQARGTLYAEAKQQRSTRELTIDENLYDRSWAQ